MRKAAQTSLVVVFVLAFLAAPVRAKVVEQLIAVIDGEPYTLSDFASYAKRKMSREFPSGDLKSVNPDDREVLEHFITDKLLEAEVREAGIKITAEDVDRYIAQIKAKNRLTDDDLKTALSREGHTLESYRASVKTELEKNEIIDREVRKRVNITNDDVERYYQLNAKNYRSDERAKLRHILLSLPRNASQEEAQTVMAKAHELYKRIQAGEDFGGLAREFSQGAGHAEGGDIGWVRRGTLIGGLEEVAFEKLSAGQVSEPFRTPMGVHLVKLEALDKGKPLPLASVAPKIKDELYAKLLEERFAKWVKTDLRRKHRVDVKLPGVEFKAEDAKEGTVDALMARSTRVNRKEDRSFLSYLNPLSYITSEADEDNDPKSALYGKKVVSVFGVPLFTRESVEDVPDVLSPPPNPPAERESKDGQSGGFFSSIFDSLNPFKR
jgi:peptidyl-prolyl cis-trans isomerase SurA